MKRIIKVTTTLKLGTDKDFKAYCEMLAESGVPPLVVGELWKNGTAGWTSNDMDGPVSIQYEISKEETLRL